MTHFSESIVPEFSRLNKDMRVIVRCAFQEDIVINARSLEEAQNIGMKIMSGIKDVQFYYPIPTDRVYLFANSMAYQIVIC